MRNFEAGPSRAHLSIRDGRLAGNRYALAGEEILIGRGPSTSITLLDDGISREHALILWDCETDEYTIEDLQSTNGTKVNGKRVRSATLNEGDEIQVGHTRLCFSRTSPSK